MLISTRLSISIASGLCIVTGCAVAPIATAQEVTQPAEAVTMPDVKIEETSAKSVSFDQLKVLQKSARTSAERVAVTDAWIKAHPEARPRRIEIASFEVRMAALKSRQSLEADSSIRDRAARSMEVRRVLNETLATAKTPQEAVALTDAFVRVNAVAPWDFSFKMPTKEERRARLLQMNAQRPAQPGDMKEEIAQVLREIRAEARTSQETVALTAEFFRLNADSIAEIQSTRRKNLPNIDR